MIDKPLISSNLNPNNVLYVLQQLYVTGVLRYRNTPAMDACFDIRLCVLFRDGEESQGINDVSDPKEKALANRRGNRHHPYKNGGVGDKKGGQRNRVFISNIPYDMKWQAIKDLMREKGNHACA